MILVDVVMGATAMKGYSIFSITSSLEPYHQIVSSHIQNARWGILSTREIELFDISTVLLCLMELFEIELILHLTVCKQKTVYSY